MARPLSVHRCRFFEHQPAAINSLAWLASTQRLVVVRSDGDIEIWRSKPDFHLERRLAASKDLVAECAAVTPDGRLFTAGAQANIVEWDLVELKPKFITDSYGGAVWSLAISHSGNVLAAGCEDGSVRLFDIDDRGLAYRRALEVQKGTNAASPFPFVLLN